MQNWKVTPAEVFAASPLVPVMVINDLEQALPMAKALLDGGGASALMVKTTV